MSSTGRSSRIILLDGTMLNFHVHNKLLGSHLLYSITSQLSLTEPQYFGLSFFKTPINSSTRNPSIPPRHHYHHREWLQLDKKILDQDVAKKSGELVFHFQIKYYVDCVCSLSDILTVELFYQQARSLVAQEVLSFDSKDTIELASFALQEAVGDYVNDQTCRETMKSLSLLTTSLLKTYPSITYCENQVIERHKQLAGTSRGLALLRYIFLVEKQPSYGQHYYDVKDKCGLPWLLGVGSKGLTLCDHNDPKNPRRSFSWNQLSNLNTKEKKFHMQLQDHKRSSTTYPTVSNAPHSISTSRQRHPSIGSSTHNPSLVWVCSTSQLAKSLWQMAVEQHQFASTQQTSFVTSHQGRPQRPASKLYNDYSSKFIHDLAEDITIFGVSPPRRSSLYVKQSRDEVGSSQSLSSKSSSQTSNSQCSDMGLVRPFSDKSEYKESLKHKRAILDQLLKEKIDHYQSLCDEESELTGTECSDVTELLALSFNKAPYGSNLINGRVKASMKGVANSLTSVTSSMSEGSRLVPQGVGTMLLGTGFHLSHKHMLRNLINPNPSELDRLELELDLQSKIQSAALRLAHDDGVAKSIKKKRKKSYKEATKKVRDLESKVMKLRREEEKTTALSTCSLNRNSECIRDRMTRDVLYMRPVTDLKMTSSSSLTSSSMTSSSMTSSSIQSQESCSEATTTSSSNIKSSCSNISSSSSSSPSASSLTNKMTTSQSCHPIITGGYLPSSVYKTRTQYRSTTYPTIPAINQTNHSQNGHSIQMVNNKMKMKDSLDEDTKHSGCNDTTPIKPYNSNAPVPHTIQSQLSSTNDEADLDLTLTGSCCETTLNSSTVSDSFSSDTLKSSNGNNGLRVVRSSPKVRTMLNILPNFNEAKSLDSKVNSSDMIHKSGHAFSKIPSKTTSYLSIYLNINRPESSKSDADLTQMDATLSLDILTKSNLTTTLSNPATLSSQPQVLAMPRLSLDNKGNSQINLLIKNEKNFSMSEDNFYDIKSKRIVRYESKDDFQRVSARDTSNNFISPPASSTKVLISPKKITSHQTFTAQLPEPEYMPCLRSNGKRFFNYPPTEVILNKNNTALSLNEQQFSYLEKVQKLRLRGTLSPPTPRKIDALIS